MAGLPRGIARGMLVGAGVAVLWGMLADRHRRTALAGAVVQGTEEVPFLGSRLLAVLAGQMVGVYRAVAEETLVEIRSGELLELGSGGGHLAAELGARARDLQVTTMDPAQTMVQVSEARIHASGVGKQVKVALGRAGDIPFPDESFDAILSVGVLHRWRAPEAALREIHRVLRPGGRAWIYDLRREMPEEGWELVRRRMSPPAALLLDVGVMASWRAAYTEGEIAALVARSPFPQATIGVLVAEIGDAKVPAVTRVTLQK